jgi:hypothetical protein
MCVCVCVCVSYLNMSQFMCFVVDITVFFICSEQTSWPYVFSFRCSIYVYCALITCLFLLVYVIVIDIYRNWLIMMCSNVKISFYNIVHVLAMKAYGRSRGTPPLILNLCTRWR